MGRFFANAWPATAGLGSQSALMRCAFVPVASLKILAMPPGLAAVFA
jgi:hypothetical protein